MSKTSKGLGRGLTDMPHYQDHYSSGAKQKHPLIRSIDSTKVENKPNTPRIIGQMAGNISLIPIGQIIPNKDQPRTEFDKKALKKLASSIEKLGIIQPITVRKLSALKYQIISGERRFRVEASSEDCEPRVRTKTSSEDFESRIRVKNYLCLSECCL